METTVSTATASFVDGEAAIGERPRQIGDLDAGGGVDGGFSARSLRMFVARGSANSAAIAGAAMVSTADTHSPRSMSMVQALSSLSVPAPCVSATAVTDPARCR